LSYNNELGNKGEKIAKKYLINKGFRFLSENYFTNKGEIDLIFIKDEILIFVEVKTRKNKNNFDTAIDLKKVKKIYNSANIYIEKENVEFNEVRFDMIFIYLNTRDKAVEIGYRPNFF